jgi:hypothetical protein
VHLFVHSFQVHHYDHQYQQICTSLYTHSRFPIIIIIINIMCTSLYTWNHLHCIRIQWIIFTQELCSQNFSIEHLSYGFTLCSPLWSSVSTDMYLFVHSFQVPHYYPHYKHYVYLFVHLESLALHPYHFHLGVMYPKFLNITLVVWIYFTTMKHVRINWIVWLIITT